MIDIIIIACLVGAIISFVCMLVFFTQDVFYQFLSMCFLLQLAAAILTLEKHETEYQETGKIEAFEQELQK